MIWPFQRKAQPEAVRSVSPPKRQPLRRSYNAGGLGRLNSTWGSAPQSADQVVFNNLRTLRARSREQRQNNDYARKFIGMVKTNVVGHEGVRLQSLVADQTGVADQLVRDAIHAEWRKWSKQADLSGVLHFIDLQALAMATLAGDGEVLIRKHQSGPYGLQLELIDPELLDPTYVGTYQKRSVMFGIEYSDRGAVVAYHLRSSQSQLQSYLSPYNSGYYVRIPAAEIIHLYLPEFVGQKRGIPWMATPLQRMKMASAYEDAALVAARVGASKMGFFSNKNGESYEGEGTDDDGAAVMSAEAGTFENIGALEFQSFDPDYPKGEFAAFMKQTLRGISAGLGVDYNAFANDMSDVNYSSARVAMLETREVWKTMQGFFIRQLVEPVFLDWIETQLLLGTIKIPSRTQAPKPLNRPLEYYTPARFQGRRWQWVDPQKEVTAKREEYKLRLTSISRIITERGDDPDEIFAEIAQEKAKLEALGISPSEVLEAIDQETQPDAD